jgi:pimeloyl-ACP methyl ester carboxylesterase
MSVRRTGTGQELVWIHGLGESSTSFDPVIAKLPQYSHVLVDLPGYGRTAWPDTPADLDATADHLATWLRERPAAIVIGHSMGGVLATLIAERGAARAIIDIDGNISGGDCTFSLQIKPFTADEFAAHGFAEMRARIYADGATQPPLRGYHAAMCFASPYVFHHQARHLVELAYGGTLAPRLAALTIPALFIAGGVNGGICAESRALLDRHGVTWVAFEPSGHWVYLDQLEAFVAAVAGFVARS